MAFNPGCGTNISHWLSQSEKRGKQRIDWFIREDVSRIADMGFNHIRIPIDEVQMWREDGSVDNESFDLLNSSIYWCERENLKAIVDLHILRNHYFNDRSGVSTLFTDPDEMERFAGLWRSISRETGFWSEKILAYEILNEPVAPDNEDWNRVCGYVFKALREVQPERTILLGSNNCCSVDTFDALRVPDDKNIILTFHFYHPMLLTHYTAPWWEGGVYQGPVRYPGKTIPEEEIEKIPSPLKEMLKEMNEYCDRGVMLEKLSKPLLVAKNKSLPLYCGEFGCYKKVPEKERHAWYRDFISILKEQGISYANWDYRGDFGILDQCRKETNIAGMKLC